ncbi:MAG: folate family ECF transporter S component [Oscillospiraceae bacterium]|nr:folate family ECF transporter S component [Oscillospiraceae bacterium]
MIQSTFSPAYWKAAWGELKSLRRLVFAALICALCVVVGSLFITVGDNLRVKFTFFFVAVGSAVYGPILGLLVGAVSDILGYVLFPSGAFFPGYTLSSMLGALIYALLLYRKKITVLRLFCAKFLVNYLVNVLLGSLWSRMMFGKGYLYYMTTSLIKNSLLLPVEVMLLAALFAVLLPVFSRMGLLPGHEKRELDRLTLGSSALPVFGLDCIAAACFSLYYSTTLENGVLIFRILAGVLFLLGIGLLLGGAVQRRRQTAV